MSGFLFGILHCCCAKLVLPSHCYHTNNLIQLFISSHYEMTKFIFGILYCYYAKLLPSKQLDKSNCLLHQIMKCRNSYLVFFTVFCICSDMILQCYDAAVTGCCSAIVMQCQGSAVLWC